MSGIVDWLDPGAKLEALTAVIHERLFVGRRRIWVTAALIVLLTWQVNLAVPTAGPDQSWMAGLYMAVHSGKNFGSEIVFTYGPLGFLSWPALWVSGLGIMAFLFSALIFFAFAAMLIAALERSTDLITAAVVSFLFFVTLPDLEQVPLMIAVGLCFFALREDPPEWGVGLLAIGGGAISAFECLIKLSGGPAIFVVCLLGMAGSRASRKQWAWFLSFAIGGLILLWLLAGQAIGDLWDYIGNGAQIVTGYNEAMAIGGAPTWEAAAILFGAVGLVIVTLTAPFADRRAHCFAVALVGVAAFTVYKYGIVRFEAGHVSLALSAILGIWLQIPMRRAWRGPFLVATAVIGIVFIHAYPNPPRLDVLDNLQALRSNAELVVRPGLRKQKTEEGRAAMQAAYGLDATTLAALGTRRASIEPWEIGIAWAYDLNWSPVPVFQNYSAYTRRLDRLNASALRDPEGPQVILRQNPGNSLPWGARTIEGRLPAWDPPEQAVATLCNFVSTNVVPSWQVLSRVPSRCGREVLASTVSGESGEEIAVPQAHRGEVVILRLKGVEIEGLEKLKSLLWKPPIRTAVLNGGQVTYRLVPGTSGDGMIVSRDPALDGSLGFEELPQLTHLRIEGVSRGLRFSFYRMKVRRHPRISPPGRIGRGRSA